MPQTDQNLDIESQLRQALAECERLKAENTQLREQLQSSSSSASVRSNATTTDEAVHASESQPIIPIMAAVTHTSPASQKISLFKSLFNGRTDVYPAQWISRDGRAGYAPACANEWRPFICEKPKVKCGECPNRQLLPLTDKVLFDHLTGKKTIGVYPLLADNSCHFLAVDFDKSTWKDDALAFLVTCRSLSIPAYIERSRSGNGAHVWIFFAHPVAANIARQLGSAIITKTCARARQLSLDSYDRLFPNQDILPTGGFGNLIALPLQLSPRHKGNSVFVDDNFDPYPDQWAFLASVNKIEPEQVEAIVAKASAEEGILGVKASVIDDDAEQDPWTLPLNRTTRVKRIEGPLPDQVKVTLSNLVYVEKVGLSPPLLNQIIRIAAFQNPEFYKAQAMRMPTYGKPRIIGCAEEFPRHIGLPRGSLEELLTLLNENGIKAVLADERFEGQAINYQFAGQLRPRQAETVDALIANEIGILSAPTAFGKTVAAASIIARRRVNTLILVHRTQLLEQWQERLATFLEVPLKSIGVFGGGKHKLTGSIDIAVIQSLHRKGEIKDFVRNYGQIIVDECHHISAFSFERVLKAAKAKYVLGLTATPTRRDGHHPIIVMQCGPIRHVVPQHEGASSFPHYVIKRMTDFRLAGEIDHIQDVFNCLALDGKRNTQIIDDVCKALEQGRKPLILTERKDHLDILAHELKLRGKRVYTLFGGMKAKIRRQTLKEIACLPHAEERVLLATGRFIGEGFDDSQLDTLFLTMPVSWRGTLQQYAGRLHRAHDNKKDVQIYDYVDEHVVVLSRMFRKRLNGYKLMGYSLSWTLPLEM